MRERSDIGRAEETVEVLRQELDALGAEFEEEVAKLEDGVDDTTLELDELVVRPRKTDIQVERIGLLWMPWWQHADGRTLPAFE